MHVCKHEETLLLIKLVNHKLRKNKTKRNKYVIFKVNILRIFEVVYLFTVPQKFRLINSCLYFVLSSPFKVWLFSLEIWSSIAIHSLVSVFILGVIVTFRSMWHPELFSYNNWGHFGNFTLDTLFNSWESIVLITYKSTDVVEMGHDRWKITWKNLGRIDLSHFP